MHTYRNGNYFVLINPYDGTKIRMTMDNTFRPIFAESADVTLTYKCDGGCPFCYADCTENGKHADLSSDNINAFIESLHPYTELALNGNDLSIPGLDEFLQKLKEKKVIANLTVNQKHFIKHKVRLQYLMHNNLISGLGVSATDINYTLFDTIDWLNDFGLKDRIIIHVVAGVVHPYELNMMANKGLKLLILGYKTKGRGKEFHNPEVDVRIKQLEYLIPTMFEQKWFNLISFDNLALIQLDIENKVPKSCWRTNYMGDDGTFTFFIDLVNETYAKNSLAEETIPITDWNIDSMFSVIRNSENKEERNEIS